MKFFKAFLAVGIVGAAAFTSCQKDPSMDDLDNKYIVQTEKASDVNFGKFSTYFVNDTVFVIGGSNDEKTEKWDYEKSTRAKGMIDKVIQNMDERGYTRLERAVDGTTPNAQLGLQIVYMQNAYLYYGYGYNSWYDYWGAWNGGWNWGGYYPGYYSYPLAYSYSTGSVIVDMMDNTAPVKIAADSHEEGKPIIWNAYASGLLSSNKTYNQNVVEWSIDQAFDQSPYITSTAVK